MTTRVRLLHRLGYKHGYKHLTKDFCAALLIAVFAISTLMPRTALAFEAQLSSASAQRLVAQVTLLGRGSLPAVLPTVKTDYSKRLASSVVARPSAKTVAGKVSVRKLAQTSIAVPDRPMPKPGDPLVMEGEASFYSRAGCLGCSPALRMANGQSLDDNALTMAIGADKKHLVGHAATVTNLATGLSVDVLITDTGGFHGAKYGHRVADLTIASKQAIGMSGGVAQVRVEVH